MSSDDSDDEAAKTARRQGTVAWNPEDVPPAARSSGTMPFTAGQLAGMAAGETAAEPEVQPDTPANAHDPLVGTLLRNKWRVLKRLGAGSFGTVYKVQDVKGGWIEALKILGVDRMTGAEAEEMRKRFLREAQIMKRLGTDSHHIVGLSTYEEDIEAGLVYFLMEFVEGRSLARVLEEEGPFSVERTIGLALQVCDALMAAHEGPEPVVHRDLKLENLMLTKDRAGDEMVKVLDFGIAQIAEREADSRLTTVGALGTPGYAAPEQLRAEIVDGRTDLFAFGVILYALLTGRDPWLGKLAYEPTHQIYELMAASDRAQMIPMAKTGTRLQPAMANVVSRLLQRDPDDRYQSARELRDALQHVLAGGEVETVRATAIPPAPRTARPAGPGPRAGRPEPRRGGQGRLVAFAGVAVALATGAYFLQPWGRTLDAQDLRERVAAGAVTQAWLDDGGVGGYLTVGPLMSPFFTSLPESELPAAVAELRSAGVSVDTSWEVRRLRDLAAGAQAATRYYGLDGGDVRSYALKLAALQPDSPEARSLLLKVGERMAWDAEVAIAEGSAGRAQELLRQCFELVPGHGRCRAVTLPD